MVYLKIVVTTAAKRAEAGRGPDRSSAGADPLAADAEAAQRSGSRSILLADAEVEERQPAGRSRGGEIVAARAVRRLAGKL